MLSATAVAVWVPVAAPSVHRAVAVPSPEAVISAGDMLPPPLATDQRICTPATAPEPSTTLTTRGRASPCPVNPDCPSPLTLTSVRVERGGVPASTRTYAVA